MIISCILLFVLAVIFISKNKGMDLISAFCLIWTVVFAGASLKLYGMRDYSLNIVGILCLGTFSFLFFAFLGRYRKYATKRIKNNWLNSPIHQNIEVNKYIVNFFMVIVSIFVLYSFMRMMELMLRGVPFGTIHAMYLNRGGEAFYTIAAMSQIHSKIVIPCIYCLVPLIAYYSMVNFKNHRKFVLIGLVNIALYTVATGSRSIIIFLLVDVVLTLPFSKIVLSEKAFKQIKKIGKILVVLLGVGIVYYTIIRKGFGSDSETNIFAQVFGEIYKYFSLCVPLADYWVDQINGSEIITYGKMSFNGILSLIEWIGVQFFGTGTFTSLDICRDIASNLEIMQPIFADASCNAFVTYAFYFYTDFRWIGVFAFSSIWGFVCGSACKRIKVNQTPASILFYLLLAQSIAMSYSRWSFYDAPYLLAFIFMRLFFVKGNKNEKLSRKRIRVV